MYQWSEIIFECSLYASLYINILILFYYVTQQLYEPLLFLFYNWRHRRIRGVELPAWSHTVGEVSDHRDFWLQTRVFASILWTLPWMVILFYWESGKGICLVLYTLQAYLLIWEKEVTSLIQISRCYNFELSCYLFAVFGQKWFLENASQRAVAIWCV